MSKRCPARRCRVPIRVLACVGPPSAPLMAGRVHAKECTAVTPLRSSPEMLENRRRERAMSESDNTVLSSCQKSLLHDGHGATDNGRVISGVLLLDECAEMASA